MYTLAIDDTVDVPVKFTLKTGAGTKTFAFSVQATRLEQNVINDRLSETERKVTDFMADVITGWSGQRLVLGPDGQPAEFSPDALAAMFRVAGVAQVLFSAYLKESAAREKN